MKGPSPSHLIVAQDMTLEFAEYTLQVSSITACSVPQPWVIISMTTTVFKHFDLVECFTTQENVLYSQDVCTDLYQVLYKWLVMILQQLSGLTSLQALRIRTVPLILFWTASLPSLPDLRCLELCFQDSPFSYAKPTPSVRCGIAQWL